MNDTDTERLLTATLAHHAADAPDDHLLLTRVQARLSRRRSSGRRIGAILVACAAVSTAIIATHSALDRSTEQPLVHQPPPAPAPGWRWESYRTVQVQVPAAWSEKQISGPAPCLQLAGSTSAPAPAVGRLNPWVPLAYSGCSVAVLPLAQRAEYVWFNDTQEPGIKQYDGGWIEETRRVADVKISVLTRGAGLRDRILDTARPITGVDYYGCTPASPSRPSNGPGLDGLGTVRSVELCDYWQGGLIVSTRYTGRQATQLAAAIKSSPTTDSVPNRLCEGSDSATERTSVVRLLGTGGTLTALMPVSFCFEGQAHPFDDGSRPRLLSRSTHSQIRIGLWAAQPSDTFDPVGPQTPPAR